MANMTSGAGGGGDDGGGSSGGDPRGSSGEYRAASSVDRQPSQQDPFADRQAGSDVYRPGDPSHDSSSGGTSGAAPDPARGEQRAVDRTPDPAPEPAPDPAPADTGGGASPRDIAGTAATLLGPGVAIEGGRRAYNAGRDAIGNPRDRVADISQRGRDVVNDQRAAAGDWHDDTFSGVSGNYGVTEPLWRASTAGRSAYNEHVRGPINDRTPSEQDVLQGADEAGAQFLDKRAELEQQHEESGPEITGGSPYGGMIGTSGAGQFVRAANAYKKGQAGSVAANANRIANRVGVDLAKVGSGTTGAGGGTAAGTTGTATTGTTGAADFVTQLATVGAGAGIVDAGLVRDGNVNDGLVRDGFVRDGLLGFGRSSDTGHDTGGELGVDGEFFPGSELGVDGGFFPGSEQQPPEQPASASQGELGVGGGFFPGSEQQPPERPASTTQSELGIPTDDSFGGLKAGATTSGGTVDDTPGDLPTPGGPDYPTGPTIGDGPTNTGQPDSQHGADTGLPVTPGPTLFEDDTTRSRDWTQRDRLLDQFGSDSGGDVMNEDDSLTTFGPDTGTSSSFDTDTGPDTGSGGDLFPGYRPGTNTTPTGTRTDTGPDTGSRTKNRFGPETAAPTQPEYAFDPGQGYDYGFDVGYGYGGPPTGGGRPPTPAGGVDFDAFDPFGSAPPSPTDTDKEYVHPIMSGEEFLFGPNPEMMEQFDVLPDEPSAPAPEGGLWETHETFNPFSGYSGGDSFDGIGSNQPNWDAFDPGIDFSAFGPGGR